jgi:predicted dehydrogenase
VEDTAVAVIRFANQALGVVHATTAAYPGVTARLQIHGDRGSAVIDDDVLEYIHLAAAGDEAPEYGLGRPGNQQSRWAAGVRDAEVAASPDLSVMGDAHAAQYRDFVSAIVTGRAPAVTLDDAIRTLDVVAAIYESSLTGSPIQLGVQEVARR